MFYLRSYSQCVTHLCFARATFAKHFGHRTRTHTSIQYTITSCREECDQKLTCPIVELLQDVRATHTALKPESFFNNFSLFHDEFQRDQQQDTVIFMTALRNFFQMEHKDFSPFPPIFDLGQLTRTQCLASNCNYLSQGPG